MLSVRMAVAVDGEPIAPTDEPIAVRPHENELDGVAVALAPEPRAVRSNAASAAG